jgi:hypothetical protein
MSMLVIFLAIFCCILILSLVGGGGGSQSTVRYFPKTGFNKSAARRLRHNSDYNL